MGMFEFFEKKKQRDVVVDFFLGRDGPGVSVSQSDSGLRGRGVM